MNATTIHPLRAKKMNPAMPEADFSALRDFDYPKITRIGDNLYAACFSVIKLFAARAILDDAVRTGALKPDSHVIESTSGTFGLALAMLRASYGYQLTLVSDPVIDPMLRMRLESLGAHLDIVESPQDGSYQVARLARVREFMARTPNAFFTNQYYNPVNATGYARLADDLAARIGHIDCLVGSVGTGGSMCGTARRLRTHFPQMQLVGVDTHRSVVFGQPNGPRQLRGLGNSLVPGNVDHALFDTVHWVSAAEAYRATQELHAQHGLFMGGTTGAAFMAARWHAAQNPEKTTVFICPDEGYRYLETVYNNDFIATLPGADAALPEAPEMVDNPQVEMTRWSMMQWNRRPLESVLESNVTSL
jgi:cysteine synthase